MVDGININNPSLPSTGEVKDPLPKRVVAPGSVQDKETVNQASGTKDAETENISSAISKSADERFDALVSGNVQDFLKAAEKFIDASLPGKGQDTRLRIDLDTESGRFVYQGIDVKTGEVVTQFPAEEVLKQLAFYREQSGIEGIVIDERV